MSENDGRIDRLEKSQTETAQNMTAITIAVNDIASAVKYEQEARKEDKQSMKETMTKTLDAVHELTKEIGKTAALAQDISTLKENTRIMSHDLNKGLQALALLPEHEKAIIRLGGRMDTVETQCTKTETKLEELTKEFNAYKTEITNTFAAMTTKVDGFKTWVDKVTGGAAVVSWGGRVVWALIGAGGFTLIALLVKQMFGIDVQITEEP